MRGVNPIKTRGYTLIEILVAFAILGLLIAPISGVFNMIIKTNDISKNKTEIANVMNYAFESCLKVLSSGRNKDNIVEIIEDLPKEHLGYKIEYNLSEKSKYDLTGIRYDDYDAVIIIDNGKINSQNVSILSNLLKLKVSYYSSVLKYEIYSDNKQIFTVDVSNPKYIVLLQINSPYQIIVDGIYDSRGIINKNLTVKYISELQNIKLISIYPTVYFEANPFVATSTEQDIKMLTITVKKNGKLIDSKTFDITNRI